LAAAESGSVARAFSEAAACVAGVLGVSVQGSTFWSSA
jgi:hypothetical protein